MDPAEIRRRVEDHLSQFHGKPMGIKLGSVSDPGYSVSQKVEDWVYDQLRKVEWQVDTLHVGEFLTKVLKEKYPKGSAIKPESVDQQVKAKFWWGFLLSSRSAVLSFYETGKAKEWQQSGADLVLVQDPNRPDWMEHVVLLNVKSHNVVKKGRAPNIMSGERLLKFFNSLLTSPRRDSWISGANLWFVGIDYNTETQTCERTHVKDLFMLDVDHIPQINFDAALQIQWHVSHMKEVRQSKEDFMRHFVERFETDWKRHAKTKSEEFEGLIESIRRELKASHTEYRQSSLV